MRKGTKSFRRVDKARQAMLAAISIYNNPLITFKSEICISLACTAWTYLLQAFCQSNGIEIRKRDPMSARQKFKKTEDGDYVLISLKEMVEASSGLLTQAEQANLQLLIKVRNKIQHSADATIDALIADNIQANVMNFQRALKTFTNGQMDIADSLNLSLQLSSLSFAQTNQLLNASSTLPELRTFIASYEADLSDEVLKDTAYSAKVRFELENRGSGKEAMVLNVCKIGDEIPPNAAIVANKEVEKPKYLPGEIVSMMKQEGYESFTMKMHTDLWKVHYPVSRKQGAGYGTTVSGGWFWYKKWIDEIVRPFCENELCKDKDKAEA